MKNLLCALLVLGLTACLPENDQSAADAPERPLAMESTPSDSDEEVITTEHADVEEGTSATASTPAAILFPPALLYNGEPIDPLCFAVQMSGEDSPQRINLTPDSCRSDDLTDLEYFSKGPYDRAVHYQYADIEDSMGRPYMMIQYAGPALEGVSGEITHPAIDEAVPVIIRTSGGGTGQFSTLYKMQRVDEQTLAVTETIAAGDRCNSGITEAFLDADGDLNYALNLTPYTMVVLGGDEDRAFMDSVEPYDDLDDCAACCYGEAHYNEDQLGYITLNENAREMITGKEYREASLVEQTKQMCFDELIALQFQAGQTSFTPTEWETFITEVEHTCLGRQEGQE